MNICAITVAYNNPNELEDLLKSLIVIDKQLLRGLIIIDNSNESYIKLNNQIYQAFEQQFQKSKYIVTDSNLGSSGGFELGMQLAGSLNFDWVWLLDQDGIVLPNSLETLSVHSGRCRILCPSVVDISNIEKIITEFRCKKNLLGGVYPIPEAMYKLPQVPIDYFGTHGTLIPMSIIGSIGYYDKDHFFAGFEDWDFAKRAKSNNYLIELIPNSKVAHPDKWRSSNHWYNGIKKKLSRYLPLHLGTIDTNLVYDERKIRSILGQNYFGCFHLNCIQYVLSLTYSTGICLFSAIVSRTPENIKTNFKLAELFSKYKIQLIRTNYQKKINFNSIYHCIQEKK